MKIEVRFWVNSRRLPFLEATSLAAQGIKENLMLSGIELPTEIYGIEFRNAPTDIGVMSTNAEVALNGKEAITTTADAANS